MGSLGSVLNGELVKLGHFLKDRVEAACEESWGDVCPGAQLRGPTAAHLGDVWVSVDLQHTTFI